MAGGRGGGKTYSVALLAIRHLYKYGDAAKVLLVRESYKSLSQVEELIVGILSQAFPGRVKFARQEHIVRIDGGGTFEFGQLENSRDVNKYLGKECTLLVIDEFALLRESKWITLLKSNLRSPAGVPLRTLTTQNPGGLLHQHVYKHHIAGRMPWHPYELEHEIWVTVPSTLRDNPHLDQEDYTRRIKAATAGDPELTRAWLENDWAIRAGNFFHEWDPAVHLLPMDLPFRIDRSWGPLLSLDHGVTAPTCCLFGGWAPGDVPGIPRGSIVVFDEVCTADMSDEGLNSSLGWPLSKIAESISERCSVWQMHAQGVADDAVGHLGSVGDTLIAAFQNDYHISFRKPVKGRVASLAMTKSMLTNAVQKNGKPGLYVSERCEYLVRTLPIIQTDSRKRDDINTAGPDHGIDALRYLLNSAMPTIKVRATTLY